MSPRAKKQPKETCTFKHDMKIEISQAEARCIAMGGFLPRTVADKLIADIERTYNATAARERVAKLVDPTLSVL